MIARIRRGLATHTLDRIRVERGKIARFHRETPAQRDRAAAPLLEWRVVKERVRPAVHNLVRERRRLDGVG